MTQCRTGTNSYVFWTNLRMENDTLLVNNEQFGTNGDMLHF